MTVTLGGILLTMFLIDFLWYVFTTDFPEPSMGSTYGNQGGDDGDNYAFYHSMYMNMHE